MAVEMCVCVCVRTCLEANGSCERSFQSDKVSSKKHDTVETLCVLLCPIEDEFGSKQNLSNEEKSHRPLSGCSIRAEEVSEGTGD